MPLDFDDAFYNAAHPDLIAPRYLAGGEEVVLEGMGPRNTRFWLPRLAVTMVAPPNPEVHAAALDTVFVDVEAGRLILRWALRLPDSDLLDEIRVHAS